MSHSKRNTSLAFFTSYERASLKGQWGSSQTRLTRDSFLPFGSCNLCLLPARDPVACNGTTTDSTTTDSTTTSTSGRRTCHLFCRECALNNLVAQKKEMKRLEKERERRKVEDAEEDVIRRAEEDADAVANFEAVQMGLEKRFGGSNENKIIGRQAGKIVVEQQAQGGTKRKLEIDEDELVQAGNDHLQKSQKVDIAKEARANTAIPSFWIPSATQGLKGPIIKQGRLHPICPASAPESSHEFSLKTLVSVHFAEDNEGGGKGEGKDGTGKSCPACNKTLTNSTKAVLAKPCGHVLCKPCTGKFMKPSEADAHDKDAKAGVVNCYVCQADVTERPPVKKDKKDKEGKEDKEKIRPGLMEISCEGTGFASGGKNMVTKKGVAFKC